MCDSLGCVLEEFVIVIQANLTLSIVNLEGIAAAHGFQ
jgi:hypothetical protein